MYTSVTSNLANGFLALPLIFKAVSRFSRLAEMTGRATSHTQTHFGSTTFPASSSKRVVTLQGVDNRAPQQPNSESGVTRSSFNVHHPRTFFSSASAHSLKRKEHALSLATDEWLILQKCHCIVTSHPICCVFSISQIHSMASWL